MRFTALAAVREAAGTTPAWRPYVPMALMLASLVALVLALAKPENTVAVPIHGSRRSRSDEEGRAR